jgi:hypothetical protein
MVMIDRDIKYKNINRTLADLQGDFHSVINPIDTAVERAIVATLDAVLGDQVASYFLYEVRMMKDGGRIIENGREWPIRNIDDVRSYVNRNAV